MKKIILFSLALIIMASFKMAKDEEATSYKVDTKKSSVAWLGKKVTGEHNGYIQLKEGVLQADNGKLTGGTFEMDMATITCEDLKDESYNQKLVGHLKSDDFFGVSAYPTSKLEIKKVTLKGGSDYEIMGHLTIRDQTHPVTFPAKVAVTEDGITANAEITVDRSKYNVKYGSGSFFDDLGDKMIYDDFTITVDLVANSASM
jgi:polyisoprenoid-binding protein YceI